MQVEKLEVSQKTAISCWPVTPEAAGSSPVTPAKLSTFFLKKASDFQHFSLFCAFYVLVAKVVPLVGEGSRSDHIGVHILRCGVH